MSDLNVNHDYRRSVRVYDLAHDELMAAASDLTRAKARMFHAETAYERARIGNDAARNRFIESVREQAKVLPIPKDSEALS